MAKKQRQGPTAPRQAKHYDRRDGELVKRARLMPVKGGARLIWYNAKTGEPVPPTFVDYR